MTILNSTDILALNGSMLGGAVACVLICIVCFIAYVACDKIDFTLAGMAFGALLLGLVLGFGTWRHGEPTGRYTLEVTLDDTVSFKEICEEYKFIEQRGDIYVFETKEVEEK